MQNIPKHYKQVTDLKTMQELLRKLLWEFHNICQAHGLVYNLFGGTLLGAVRHQDIIPWDDDIDVTMPRPDYEKFLKIVREKYADMYEIYAYPKKNYIYPYGKFCRKDTLLIETKLQEKYGKLALYIDIFPVDGIPEMPEAALAKRYKRAEKNKKRTAICVQSVTASPCWWKKPFVIVKWLRRAVLNLFGYRYFLKKQIDETCKYAFEDCEHVGFVSSWGWGVKGITKKTEYLRRHLYQFGPYQFWGPEDYHANLSSWYGDYMTPPPENKRMAPHSYDLFVKDVD